MNALPRGRNAEPRPRLHFIQLPLSISISANVNFISPHSLNHKMVERSSQSPDIGQEELHTYLSSPLFSQKITCPRTSFVVSFSQIGDSEGCPVLFIPPAVCSRWFALPLGMSSCPWFILRQKVKRLEADVRSNVSIIGDQVDFSRSTGMWSHAPGSYRRETWCVMQ